ncbi:MAG: hypothetical protein DRJ05_02155 [Bacteroidetes bacterium]|nr:MAG: hypothetical protein DRI89_07650 [Bacteroidota bacterium]RLD61641.1 MAG: hypothetical protein DRJ05_02155 [Bacteroidota bacterium]
MVFIVFFTRGYGQKNDSLQQLINTATNDSTRIDAMIIYARAINFDEPKSALKMLDKAEALAAKQKSPYQLTSVFHERAYLFLRIGKNAESLEQLYKAKSIIESISKENFDKNMALSYIRTFNGIGMLNYKMEKYDKAIEYFQEGLNYLDEQDLLFSKQSKDYYLFYFYNNMGGLFLKKQEYPRSEYYLNKAKELVDIDVNTREYTNILINLSIASSKMGDLTDASSLVDTAMAICIEHDFKKELAAAYNTKGSCCIETKNLQSATDNFLKAFKLSKQNGFGSSGVAALSNLTKIYSEKRQFELACKYSDLLHIWKDSLRNEEEVRKFTKIELQEEFSKQLYENKLDQQQIEAAQNNREIIYIFITIAALMGMSIIILLYFLQSGRTKQHKLEAEKNKLLNQSFAIDKNNLEEELEMKKKELATNVMYSIRKNEMIIEIVAKLKEAKLLFKKENYKVIDTIIVDLESTAVDEVWKEFEVRFQQVHTGFYAKLNEQFPKLSVNEKRLCAFLRLNMSSKEISMVTYQSVNSISVARSRLRKKLGLNQDDNLISFLETI